MGGQNEPLMRDLYPDKIFYKIKILYIEDTKDDQIILKHLLEKKSKINFELVIVSDGFDGLRRVNEEYFDLIILDYKLPGMSGLEFLEKLKKLDVKTPVIFITGKGDERVAVEAMKRGAKDYIVKDETDFDRLIKAIEETALEISLPKNISVEVALNIANLFSMHEALSAEEIEYLFEQNHRLQLEEILSALDELVRVGFAERKPLHSAIACPYCGSLKPNLLLQCPHCGSGNLLKGEAIEHMNCGGVDLKFNFNKDEETLVCPKCGKKVRQLGVDYRKVGTLFKCSNGHLFSLPVFNFKCLSCEKNFEINEATLKTIFQYRLTRKGYNNLLLAFRADGSNIINFRDGSWEHS
ncbi:response regulator [Candidatus Bathyarchaeota archaeon]|nr:response regulator [Candidatus Bathyarchaeota archaeon]